MPINSRAKGARGEREWARYLQEQYEIKARRGCQFSGSPDSPDVVSDCLHHFEVKRVEKFNITEAMAQAVRDSDDKKIPTVVWRKNGGEWLVILRAKDFIPRR